MWGTAVLINLTQNLQTEKASPERTTILHTVILYQVALFLCAAEYFRCIVLSASCNNLRLMAPSIAAVSYLFFYFISFRPVSAAFLTPNSVFFDERRAFGIFLNSGP